MPAKKRASAYRAMYNAMVHSTDPSDEIHDLAVLSLVSQFSGQAHATQADYLTRPSRGSRHLSRARQKMQYLAHVGFGLSFTQIGAAMQRDRTSIAHACQQIEDLRDCPIVDKALFFSEIALQMMMASVTETPTSPDIAAPAATAIDAQKGQEFERKSRNDPC